MYNQPSSIGRLDLKVNHSAPQVWMLRWGDDIGRGFDETRFLRHTEESKEEIGQESDIASTMSGQGN